MFVPAGLTVATPHALPGGLKWHIESFWKEVGTGGNKVDLDGLGAELCLPKSLRLLRELDGEIVDGGVVSTKYPTRAKHTMHRSQVSDDVSPFPSTCK